MYAVCLHNVVAGECDEFDRKCSRISAAEFEDFLERAAARYDLISFSEFLRRLDAGRPDPRAVALTFDDGFGGVFDHAFPALSRRGLDAGVFVNPPHVSGEADGPFHFLEIELAFRLTERASAELEPVGSVPLGTVAERVRAMKRVKRALKAAPEPSRRVLHERLLAALAVPTARIRDRAAREARYRTMSKDEVLRLRGAGWPVGAHTLTHRTVGMLDDAEAEREIAGSKEMLERVLGGADPVFAYPYGEAAHIGARAPAICRRAGYRYAFTTIPGDIAAGADPHLLARVDYKEFRAGYLA